MNNITLSHQQWLQQINNVDIEHQRIPFMRRLLHIMHQIQQVPSSSEGHEAMSSQVNNHLTTYNRRQRNDFANWRAEVIPILENADNWLRQHTIRDVTPRAVPAPAPIPAPAAAIAEAKEEEKIPIHRDSDSSRDSLEDDLKFTSLEEVNTSSKAATRYANISSYTPSPSSEKSNNEIPILAPTSSTISQAVDEEPIILPNPGGNTPTLPQDPNDRARRPEAPPIGSNIDIDLTEFVRVPTPSSVSSNDNPEASHPLVLNNEYHHPSDDDEVLHGSSPSNASSDSDEPELSRK